MLYLMLLLPNSFGHWIIHILFFRKGWQNHKDSTGSVTWLNLLFCSSLICGVASRAGLVLVCEHQLPCALGCSTDLYGSLLWSPYLRFACSVELWGWLLWSPIEPIQRARVDLTMPSQKTRYAVRLPDVSETFSLRPAMSSCQTWLPVFGHWAACIEIRLCALQCHFFNLNNSRSKSFLCLPT